MQHSLLSEFVGALLGLRKNTVVDHLFNDLRGLVVVLDLLFSLFELGLEQLNLFLVSSVLLSSNLLFSLELI